MNELPPPGSTLREVLPGTPEDLDELAALLESYVDGAAAAARGLRSMDAGAWIGEAADAFWSSVGDVLKSQVLEGSVAGGGKGIVQTVITDSEAFEFSPGHAYP